jgi:hypothetical protein
MSTQNDGGPAFPYQPLDGQGMPCQVAQDGMSLRDYFAAAALSGLVYHNDYGAVSNEDIAQGAYQYADSMLAAREAKL